MRLSTLLRSSAAGAAIYVLAAACAATEHAAQHADPDASPSITAADALAAAVDGALDPVPSASAGGPESAVENCSKTFTVGDFTYLYAEHAYPGATALELASVTAIGGNGTNAPPGYTTKQVAAWVRDGAVAVVCGLPGSEPFKSVTFVRRQQ